MSSSKGNGTLQDSAEAPKQLRKPRICMPTGRNFRKKTFHCAQYEAQDVLAEVDDVDLISLEPGRGYDFKELWQRRLMYRDVSRRIVFANPGLHKVRLNREYDLFIARCQTYKDLLDINAIEGWKDNCRISVCWLDELWAASIPEQKYWLHALRQFDHVFIGYSGSVAPLSEAIGWPCRWLSGAVDTLRFTPYPDPPARVIDVYSLGRRRERIHQSLLQAARDRGVFYMYDTFAGSLAEVYDHRQHRDHYANVAKRSRYFMVGPGKFDCLDETRGQMEIGHRYYEGAAAGAVMIGEASNCEAFREMFPWSDAVIEIQPDGTDVIDVLGRLGSEPERVSAIARRNTAEALLRHDWVYRWKEILRVAGMEPSSGMVARECRLKELAELAASSAKDRRLSRPSAGTVD
jgi:glycosyl transferase family 1